LALALSDFASLRLMFLPYNGSNGLRVYAIGAESGTPPIVGLACAALSLTLTKVVILY
jgi:hypothetical protein